MVRPREFDEQQALNAAMQLFWEKGYEATSLSDLTSHMGIGRPSLYAAFGGKKELFAAALRKYTQTKLDKIQAKLQAVPSVRGSVQAFLDEMMDAAYGVEPSRGCFCVNTMVELAPHDPLFEQATRDFDEKLAMLFQLKIEKGIRTGELTGDLDAASVAWTITLMISGLSVMLKSRPDRSFVESATANVLNLLK